MASELDKILDKDEKIFWRGKPKYVAYILKYSPVMLIGFFWCSFLLPFYLLAILGRAPVFLWIILAPHTLVGLSFFMVPLCATFSFPYIEYAITSKRIITKSGFFARNFTTVDYTNLTDVSVRIGLIGRITGTGDIFFISGAGIFTARTSREAIWAVENPYEVFKLLKQVYFDIKTDIEFPNKLRPPVNPGYQSGYDPFKK